MRGGARRLWLSCAAAIALAGGALAQVGSERVTVVFGHPPLGYAVVASRLGIANYYTTADKSFMSVNSHVAAVNFQYGVVVCFPNWYYTGTTEAQQNPGASASIHASIEAPVGSTPIDLTFSGATIGTAAAGTTLCSDPLNLPLRVVEGTTFNTREYYSNSAGIVVNIEQGDYGSNCIYAAECNTTDSFTASTTVNGAPDYVNTTTTASRAQSPNVGAVSIVAARTGTPSALLIGASICEDYRNRPHANYAQGLIAPSLQASGQAVPTIPFLNACWPSGQAYDWWSGGGNTHSGSLAFYKFFHNFVIVEPAINDIISGGKTAAQAEAYVADIIADIKKARPDAAITLNTLMPQVTTSTTGWVTTAGQTPVSNIATIQAYNNAVINGTIAGNNNGYFDTAEVLTYWKSTDAIPGIWKPGPYARTASDCSATAGNPYFTSAATLDFQSTDVGYGIYVAGAGTSGAVFQSMTVSSVVSTTQADFKGPGYVTDNIVTTVSNVACGVGGQTWEGIHPMEAADALVAASGVVTPSSFHVP